MQLHPLQNAQPFQWKNSPFSIVAKTAPFSFDSVELRTKNDEKLFFPGGIENLTFMQKNVGNCQMLASLDALSRNPYGVKILDKMLKTNQDGISCDVYFASMNGKPINVKFSEVDKVKKSNKGLGSLSKFSGFRRPLGIDIIETAYAKYEKMVYPHSFKDSTLKGVYDSQAYHSSALQAMKDMTGLNVSFLNAAEGQKGKSDSVFANSTNEKIQEAIEILKKKALNSDEYLITACTTNDKKILDKKFVLWHDYSIRSVDAQGRRISLANPHDTSKPINITYDEFLNNFENITYSTASARVEV